jgi:hypothetical protein
VSIVLDCSSAELFLHLCPIAHCFSSNPLAFFLIVMILGSLFGLKLLTYFRALDSVDVYSCVEAVLTESNIRVISVLPKE